MRLRAIEIVKFIMIYTLSGNELWEVICYYYSYLVLVDLELVLFHLCLCVVSLYKITYSLL